MAPWGTLEEGRFLRWLAGSLAVMVVLLVVMALSNSHKLNTDAIPYMRIAGYWALGNTDLAVTGYWGPLISWLMMPGFWLGMMPLVSARWVMALSSLVFWGGSLALARGAGLGRMEQLAVAWAVALSVPVWSVDYITPDLLVAGLMGFATGQLASAAWPMNVRCGIAAGTGWGLAYFAKAVALPVGLAVIVLTAVCWGVAQPENRAAIKRRFVATMTTFLVFALPWIAVLSFKYAKPTFSTSGAIAHAVVGPDDMPRSHLFGSTIHEPESGRITTWEEPSGMGYAYWSPFENSDYFAHQVQLIFNNAKKVFRFLASFDIPGVMFGWLGLGSLAMLTVFFARGPFWKTWLSGRWRWMLIPLVCLGGIYLPVYLKSVDQRYFYLFLPLLLILGLGGLRVWLGRENAGNGLDVPGFRNRDTRSGKGQMAICLVALAFALPGLMRLPIVARGLPIPAENVARDLAERFHTNQLTGSIVGSAFLGRQGGRTGLYLAWHLGRPWHGDQQPSTVEGYTNSKARFAVVVRGSSIDQQLRQDTNFQDLDTLLFKPEENSLQYPVKVYQIRGN